MSKTTVKSFVNQFVALVKGDDSAVVAEKVFRKAKSALTASLAVAEGESVNLEEAISEAQENLDKARVNYGNAEFTNNSYISNLSQARERLEEAESNFELHQEKLTILKEELALLTA
jgi:chromosome segregation ATPase